MNQFDKASGLCKLRASILSRPRLAFSISSIGALLANATSTSRLCAETFTDFDGFSTEGDVCAVVSLLSEVAPVWYAGTSLEPIPGWGTNVYWDWSADFMAPFTPIEDDSGQLSAPYVSRSIILKKDADDNVLGSIAIAGTGVLDVDLRQDSAMLNEAIRTPYGFVELHEITSQTGSFAEHGMTGAWTMEVHGRSIHALLPSQEMAETTSKPIITRSSIFSIVGAYEVVREARVETPANAASAILLRFRRHGQVGTIDALLHHRTV